MDDIEFIYDVLDYLEIYSSGCPCTVYYPDLTAVAEQLTITLPPKD